VPIRTWAKIKLAVVKKFTAVVAFKSVTASLTIASASFKTELMVGKTFID
jgi:NifU-like protein involved in Fe-S cluster formation